MAAVTMHHFSGLAAPFVRSKGTISGGVFNSGSELTFFDGGFNLVPSLVKWLQGDLILGSWVKTMLVGNVLMFVPMGVLLPLAFPRLSRKKLWLAAVIVPIIIEIIQPIVGRSFDIDDLICNFIGILIGYLVAHFIKKAIH